MSGSGLVNLQECIGWKQGGWGKLRKKVTLPPTDDAEILASLKFDYLNSV